jgi:hypothetical protein
MQIIWQVPIEQTEPFGHTLPQDPQFALSVCTLAQYDPASPPASGTQKTSFAPQPATQAPA